MVSDSVSKKFGIKKVSDSESGIIWYKKVLDLVSKIFVINKSFRFSIGKYFQKDLGFVCFKHGFVKFGICIGIGFKTFLIFSIVSDSV